MDKVAKDAIIALGIKELVLASDVTLSKPLIVEDELLDANEQEIVEKTLKAIPVFEGEDTDHANYVELEAKQQVVIAGKKVVGVTASRNLIHKELKPARNDYQHDFDRGSVHHTHKCRNFSFHKVIIPDGTVIREANFTQKDAHTVAIEGKNLTFIDCNLVNVEIDPSWTVQGCNTAQIKRVVTKQTDKEDGITELEISHQVEQKGEFVEVSTDKEIHKTEELEYSIKRLVVSKDVIKISEVKNVA
jgi:hypothetical protein